MIANLRARPDLVPSLAVLAAGAAWGLFWLPIRALEDAGLHGVWVTVAFYCTAAILLLPFAWWRRRQVAAMGWGPIVTGLFTGAAFGLYATSILMTEVVRTLLLFYMMPVWGTLFGYFFLSERLTANRLAAIGLGFAGLYVILASESGLPWPRNTGDWMALLSGIFWAYGSLRLYRDTGTHVMETTFAFVLSGLLVAVVMLALPLDTWAHVPTPASLAFAAPETLAISGLYFLPVILLSLWGAAQLSPGRTGILFMAEIVVGVTSAALLAGEPFGAREAIGSALVIGAGFVEVIRRQPAVDRSLSSSRSVPPV